MTGKKLEARALALKKTEEGTRGICEYADKCPKAKDGETFRRYCDNDGEYCPDKFGIEMGKEQ